MENGNTKSSLRELIEIDMARQLGKPINIKRFWTWLIIDFFFIQLIVGPFTVSVWCAGWQLYDTFFFWIARRVLSSSNSTNENDTFESSPEYIIQAIICLVIGTVSSILLVVFSQNLEDFAARTGRDVYFLVSRLFSVLRFFTTLLYWKGSFDLLYSVDIWETSVITLSLAFVVLKSCGCFKTAAVTPPLGVFLDSTRNYVQIDSFLETKRTDSWKNRCLDGLVTTLLEIIAAVCTYATWTILDHLFDVLGFPFSVILYNHLISILLAHLLSALIFILQFKYLRFHVESTSWFLKEIFFTSLLFLSLLSTTSYIRGWWHIFGLLFVNGYPHYLEFFFLFISFAGILALGITSYNHSGISRESRREEEGILFPFFYFSYYLREKHQDQVEQNNRVLDSVVDDLVFCLEPLNNADRDDGSSH